MNVEKRAKSLEISAKGSAMADADLAASLMDEVIGERGIREPVKSMLERAYSAIRRRNQMWTRRRVRAVFNREANRIEHREIEDMRAIIQAREQHAAYREETARLTALVVARAKASARGKGTRAGGRTGGMDSSGTEG